MNLTKASEIKPNIMFLLLLEGPKARAFKILKKAFIKAPILAYFNLD